MSFHINFLNTDDLHTSFELFFSCENSVIFEDFYFLFLFIHCCWCFMFFRSMTRWPPNNLSRGIIYLAQKVSLTSNHKNLVKFPEKLFSQKMNRHSFLCIIVSVTNVLPVNTFSLILS